MKLAPLALPVAFALVVTASLPAVSRAQVLPDVPNGCGIRSASVAVLPDAGVSLAPVSRVRLGTLVGPGGTLGLEPSVWLAGLAMSAMERGAAPVSQRGAAPRRRRADAGRR
jgi:hypothetical protein